MSASGHLTDPQIEILVSRYAREMARYEGAAHFVEQRLRRALRAQALRAQISSRAKHPDDLREKLRRKRADPRYAFPLLRDDLSATVTDLAGCRVMVYHPGDEGEAAHLVRRAFRRAPRPDADEEHRKPSGYRATHLLVSIGDEEESAALHGAICEVQVTTIAAHLFNELEHHIQYKDTASPLTTAEVSHLEAVRGASAALEQMVGKLLDEHAAAVSRQKGPIDSAVHLKYTLEQGAKRPLRGDFSLLYRVLDALVQPLTPAAIRALGPVDELLRRGRDRATEVGVDDADDVVCLALGLSSVHGAEIGALARGFSGPATPFSRAILRSEEQRGRRA